MGRYIVDLPCILDTYVDWKNPSASFGAASTLLNGALTFEGYGPNNVKNYHIRYFTMLKFNYSALPAGKTITSATLRLYSINHVDNKNSSNTYPYDPFIIKPLWYAFTENDAYEPQAWYWSDYDGSRSVINTPTSAYVDIDFMSFINNTDIRNRGIALAWEGAGETLSSGAEGPTWQIGARNSANPPMIRVTYEDTIPEKPTALEPIGLYIQNTNIIQFKWQYNNSTGGIQKRFDLKWSTNGTTWTTVSQTTANNYYNMPANTFPTGNIHWKVITYNEYNEASPESNVNIFYSIGAPAAPTITNITSTSRPTVTWSSVSQQVYQIQILQGSNVVYDTGSVPSITVKSHTVTTYLNDGAYTVKIRVKNEYDLFSDWASQNFTVYTPKPDKPVISLSQNKYSITVKTTIPANISLLLYRADFGLSNLKCIAKSAIGIITDYSIESNKQYQYFARAIDSTGAYSDSDIKTITSSKFSLSVIAPVTDLGNIFEVKVNLNERPVKSIAISTPNIINYFSGRKYPVVEYSEHLSCGITLSCFIKSDAEYQRLLNIVNLKGIVLYRDGRRKFYGNISGINSTDHFNGYVVNLSINQTDYNEYLEV